MARGQYILDQNGNPKRELDLLKWAMWMEYSHRSEGKDNRIVKQDHIGNVEVSTVFLGLDHSFGSGPPVLWETMIFCGEHDGWQRRYCKRNQALIGHAKAVEMVKASQADLQELERMAEVGGWRKK